MLNHFKASNEEAHRTWTHADDYSLFENRKDPSNPVILAKIYTTKWYREFSDVDATMQYLYHCDSENIQYVYVHIGEDLEDNEELYNGDLWEYCGIQRSIESDVAPNAVGNYAQIFKQNESVNINEII